MSTNVYVFDWDLTLTREATNAAYLNWGLDLIKENESAEDILARLQPNTKEALRAIIANGDKIVIATNQVFPEVIKHHLKAIFSDKEIANHIIIKTADMMYLKANHHAPGLDLSLIKNPFKSTTEKVAWMNSPITSSTKKPLLGRQAISIKRLVNKNELIDEGINDLALPEETIGRIYYFDDSRKNIDSFTEFSRQLPFEIITRRVVDGNVSALDLLAEDQPLMECVLASATLPLQTLKLSDPSAIDVQTRTIIHGLAMYAIKQTPHKNSRLKNSLVNPIYYRNADRCFYRLANTMVILPATDDTDNSHHGIINLDMLAQGYFGKFKSHLKFSFNDSELVFENEMMTAKAHSRTHSTEQEKIGFINRVHEEYDIFYDVHSDYPRPSSVMIEFPSKTRIYQPCPHFGTSLKTILNDGTWRQFETAEKLAIMQKILHQVARMHEKSYVHHDLNLGNIVYNQIDKQIRLIDFGKSEKRSSDKSLKNGGGNFFKPYWFSSAQKPNPHYDAYSLAGIFALLAGQSQQSLLQVQQSSSQDASNDVESYSSDELDTGNKFVGYTQEKFGVEGSDGSDDNDASEEGYETIRSWAFAADEFNYLPKNLRDPMEAFLNLLVVKDHEESIRLADYEDHFNRDVVSILAGVTTKNIRENFSL